MKNFIILPTQLFKNIKILNAYDNIYLIEEPYYLNKYYHKQKILLHLSSINYYYEYLKKELSNNIYLIKSSSIDYEKITKYDTTMYHPIDKKMINLLKKYNVNFIDTPLFLTSISELNNLKYNKKNSNRIIYTQSEFYKYQRIKNNILLTKDKKPLYNQWSFDKKNREKYSKNYIEPKIQIYNNKYIEKGLIEIKKNYNKNFGEINNVYYPCTHKDAKKHLTNFIKYKIINFGNYQDGISTNIIYGIHSNISALLNIGLLTPKEVITEILKFFYKSKKKKEIINSIEGIIRQIIGWREYIRFIYHFHNIEIINKSYIKLNNKLPNSWYKGDTELNILNLLINKLKKFAYLHHIERLMIINNLMILYEIKFKDVYKWFMTCFIDSYDWVMIPNLLMNINSLDPDIKYMTRVYISSDNYIKKMSNYNNKEDYKIINNLYWNFIKKNKKILIKDYGLASQVSKIR